MNNVKLFFLNLIHFTTRQNLHKALAFPFLFIWLEVLLHVSMHSDMSYFPIYAIFSLSVGLFFSALFLIIPFKVSKIAAVITSAVISLIYIVEFMSRIILQTYYQPSTIGTALENKLSDYSQVIIDNIFSNILFIFLAFLPCILFFFIFKKKNANNEKPLALVSVILFIVMHLIGVLTVTLSDKGDINPKYLYYTDTNVDDQVEQLGLYSMIRLDIKHIFFPPYSSDTETEFITMDMPTMVTVSPVTDIEPSVDENVDVSVDAEITDQEEIQVEILDTSPNAMNIDLQAMSEESNNDTIKSLANYFKSVTPTNKNEFTGMFKDYNVIFFTLEGFSGYAVDEHLTPTLYKMLSEGFVFNNFYTALHYTSTSNGECQNLLGLYPKNGNPISMRRTGELKTNTYFCLARQLGRLGYTTLGYHNNGNMYGRDLSHPNLGYDWKYYQNGLECETSASGNSLLWPQRDSYMIEASVADYINSETPFHVYYLTITGHTPYSWNWAVRPYKDSLSHLNYSEQTKAYIATAMEVDKMMETLISKLDEAGKLDNTLIIAAPDHIPYSDVEILEEICGKTFGSSENFKAIRESDIDFEVYKNSLIIWSSSMTQPIEVNKVTCQVDILPTVSNLLGLEYDSRMLSGSDALSDREGLVIFSSRCWKTDRGFYNRFNGSFTPSDGIDMTEAEIEEYVTNMKKIVGYKLDAVPKIIESDFYNKMLDYPLDEKTEPKEAISETQIQ